MSYKKLEIWQLSEEIVVAIHLLTISLPQYEKFEEGSQIRRSSKSVKSCITEGYGRRRYKAEFIKFLTYAQASNDETLDHLENLIKTGSIKDHTSLDELLDKIEILGKKINKFIQGVEKSDWRKQ